MMDYPLKLHECCLNHARIWNEMSGPNGLRLPPSDHSPACKNYEVKSFLKVSHQGSGFICEKDELSSLELDDEEYRFEEVKMTQDQFDKLEEFEGF